MNIHRKNYVPVEEGRDFSVEIKVLADELVLVVVLVLVFVVVIVLVLVLVFVLELVLVLVLVLVVESIGVAATGFISQ